MTGLHEVGCSPMEKHAQEQCFVLGAWSMEQGQARVDWLDVVPIDSRTRRAGKKDGGVGL